MHSPIDEMNVYFLAIVSFNALTNICFVDFNTRAFHATEYVMGKLKCFRVKVCKQFDTQAQAEAEA